MVNLLVVIVILIIIWLLLRGMKESKCVNNIMVLIKIGIVVLFIVVGVFYVKLENWILFVLYGLSGVFVGGVVVFFVFLGFDVLVIFVEEVKNL